MAELPRFARVGDTVECDVRHPYQRTIRMVLETAAATAHANYLLMDPQSGWGLTAADGVPGCPESGKHCNVIEGECQTCGNAGVNPSFKTHQEN